MSERAVMRVVQRLVVDRLMDLAADPRASSEVRAIALHRLRTLGESLGSPGRGTGPGDEAHRRQVADDILRFIDRPYPRTDRNRPVDLPPGGPIGR